jgi:tRNA(Arg) A34 adenosine deaminase TadA
MNPHARTPLTPAQIDAALDTCLKLQASATDTHEKFPCASLILGPDNETVLLTHFGLGSVRHAETEVVRLAAAQYTESYLSACTLVTTWEPCCMCTGTAYWANIGRILYAASEEALSRLTGDGNQTNPTMSLPCREVVQRGQKDVEVIGPVEDWEEKTIEQSKTWWHDHQP